MKKAIVFLAACALLMPGLTAFAADSGVFTGSVVATEQVNVLAPCDGTLAQVDWMEGASVSEGDVIATYETEKVYATGDGTVTAVWPEAGEEIDGTVLEIEPIAKYTVYCTTDDAYSSEDTLMVHAGETVYIKCTEDGTHRGTGVITQIDGTEYTVETTGGEFFVGETVYLYRDADFTYTEKIGIGTLIYSDNIQYDSDGTVVALHVAAGDYVERGQLLYEVLGTKEAQILSTATGVVASVFSQDDDTATESTDVADESSASAQSGTSSAESESTEGTVATETTSGTETAVGAAGASTASEGEGTISTESASGSSGTDASESTSTQSEADAASENAVAEGDVIAVIYPYEGLMVQISVTEAQLSEIVVGAQVGVVFADDPETTCEGTVAKISSVAEDGAYLALVTVSRGTMYLGMTCDVFTQ